jgi:hypothetical protein
MIHKHNENDNGTGTDIPARLGSAADDLFVGSAPVTAIIGSGRRRARQRVVGGSVLGVAAVGAAVAVGATSFGAGSGGAAVSAGGAGAATTPPVSTHPSAAPAKPATPQPTASTPAAPTTAGDGFSKYYGTTTLATGELGGTTWKLQRTLRAATPADFPQCGGDAVEDIYIQTPDGVHSEVDPRVGGCDAQTGPIPPWQHSFGGAGVDYEAIATIDTPAKEQSSKYGSLVTGLVDDTKIAKVVLNFDDGRAPVTAQMVKAPAPEDGAAFFYIPLTDKGPENLPGQLVFYDAAGKVVHVPGMS